MEKLKIFGLLLIALFVGYSCSDTTTNPGTDTEDPIEDPMDDDNDNDDNSDETSVEEDIQHIELSLDNTLSLIEELADGSFSESVEAFLGADSGELDSEDWIETVVSGLEDVINVESTEDNARFDFAGHTGVYEWNASEESWEETSSSSEIVLMFPSSESGSGNDMTLTISEYADALTNVDGEQIYLPTRVISTLEMDGEAIFQFNLNEIQYSSNSDWPVPTKLDLEIFSAPSTYAITYSQDSDTRYLFSFNMANGNTLVTGVSLELNIAHSDYAELDEEDFENLSGSLNLTEDLAVDFNAEIGSLLALDDPSENQINSLINAEVLYQDVKIADLEYSEEEEDILIFYKDGSSETTDRYYEGFIEELEVIFYTFTGDWVDF